MSASSRSSCSCASGGGAAAAAAAAAAAETEAVSPACWSGTMGRTRGQTCTSCAAVAQSQQAEAERPGRFMGSTSSASMCVRAAATQMDARFDGGGGGGGGAPRTVCEPSATDERRTSPAAVAESTRPCGAKASATTASSCWQSGVGSIASWST
eukprot:scaffold32681_cov60-Phaeocystis_antarctica.AAC.1